MLEERRYNENKALLLPSLIASARRGRKSKGYRKAPQDKNFCEEGDAESC